MICIEAYRSAVGLWQNSSGKKQNQPLVKEKKGGDSFGNLGSHLEEGEVTSKDIRLTPILEFVFF